MFSAVFQDFNIYPISIRENIVSSNFYDSEKLLKILKELNLYSKLLKCSDGVETVASKLIDATGIDFSTGEKQMISMARAIYKPSSILILDEPTSSLDANAENLLYKKYRELSTKKISFSYRTVWRAVYSAIVFWYLIKDKSFNREIIKL